jgi:hypothetical protein
MARLMTTIGIMLESFSRLGGLSIVVLKYLPDLAPTVTI